MEKMRMEKGDGKDFNFPSCVFGRYDKKIGKKIGTMEKMRMEKGDGKDFNFPSCVLGRVMGGNKL
jgi:hypothetical protein